MTEHTCALCRCGTSIANGDAGKCVVTTGLVFAATGRHVTHRVLSGDTFGVIAAPLTGITSECTPLTQQVKPGNFVSIYDNPEHQSECEKEPSFH